MSSFVFRLLAGFLIGVGCILPGVSGGVMAVSFGLYRPMLDAATGFFRDIRKHAVFLFPLVVGGGLGVLICAGGLDYAMSHWEDAMLFLFVGLILGNFPDLFKNALSSDPFRPRFLLALLPGAVLLLAMAAAGTALQRDQLVWYELLLAGGLYALGTVFPGLSASFLLIQLGWYQPCLTLFSTLPLPQFALFGTGFVLTILATLNGVKWLFDHYHGYASFGVIGLLLASVLPAIPIPKEDASFWIDLLMLVMGTVISLSMSRLSQHIGEENRKKT